MLKHINEEIARVKENDDRSPCVHADLNQDRIVRGRLLSGMPVPQHLKQGESE